MTSVWIGIGVVALGSWYFDHYRPRKRREAAERRRVQR